MGRIRFERYVKNAEFSSEQVIEKYFKKNENMKKAVLKHVINNENLISFAPIPMLCYLLCFEMEYALTESENPDDLPVSTTDIYTKLVDIFLTEALRWIGIQTEGNSWTIQASSCHQEHFREIIQISG